MSVKISSINLKYGLILAPMAGVTDRAYRKICRKHGAELTFTEMVSAKALQYNDTTSVELGSLLPYETSTGIQLFGHESEILVSAVRKMTTPSDGHTSPVLVDINMGCPMKKIVNNGDGSALLKSPETVAQLIRSARDATNLPLTIKIRLGWDSNTKNATLIAKIAEQNGADAITVHGRTREQMYINEVDLDAIAEVKRAVSIPVIGNGGINTAEDAINMLHITNCDGLMLARGTMGNPWLFEEIKAAIDGIPYNYPDLDVRLSEALNQMHDMISDKGERVGVLEARRHMSYYIKNVNGASEARRLLNMAQSEEEINDIINRFIKQ